MHAAAKDIFGNGESSYTVSSSRSNRHLDEDADMSAESRSRSRSRSRVPPSVSKETVDPQLNSPEIKGSFFFPHVPLGTHYLQQVTNPIPELLMKLSALSESTAPLKGELPRPSKLHALNYLMLPFPVSIKTQAYVAAKDTGGYRPYIS